MAEAIGILILVVGLLVSIGLHELGHMIPAKKFGVRVSEYFVGFGPTLWSRRGRETEYGLKAIPLGGYVRMVGMVPPEDQVKPVRGTGRIARLIEDARASSVEEMHEGEDHRAFYRLTWWKKVVIMFGGPLVNLVIALILFTAVLVGIGMPQANLTVDRVVDCVPASPAAECEAGDPVSPASVAGIQPGDTFAAVDGQPVGSWSELTAYVSARPGQEVLLELTRDGAPVQIALTPAPLERQADDGGAAETLGFMGVAPQSEITKQGLGSGAELTGTYLGLMVEVVGNLPQHLYHVTLAAVGVEERSQEGIIGVVGVGRIAAETSGAEIAGYGTLEKLGDMLLLLGGLNLALFVFNMIPLVPLDGGHVASALWQAVKNGWARLRGAATPRPVDVARMMPLAYGVFGLLLLMGVVLIYADIVAPVTLS